MGFDDTGYILEEPKPPPFILWIIAIGSCLLFAASIVLIAIGAVYAYGTVGMTLVGCGAVLYFGTVVALVLSCIKVQKRYPGRRLLPSRLMPGRNIRRLSILANPHTSGSAPEKASKDHNHQEPASDPNPQEVNAQEELSPAIQNSGDSTATEASCTVVVHPNDKESSEEEQQKPSQKDLTSSDSHSDELAASATTADIKNDKLHLNHQQVLLTPQSDSPQEVNDPASTASFSSLANFTLDRSQGQYLQEPVSNPQCAADISSLVPAAVEAPMPKEKQDQQLGTMHSTHTPSTDVKEQVDALSLTTEKPTLHQLDRAPQDMQGAALGCNDCDATPDTTLSCDNVTESHFKEDAPSPNVCPDTSSSVEENDISCTLGPINSNSELLYEQLQPHKDAVGTVPCLEEVNTSSTESPPQILQSVQFHRQDPFSEDSIAQHSESFSSTLHDSPSTELNFVYHQCQQQVAEETSPKAQRSVNFASATPPLPTKRRKQIQPEVLDQYHPNVPTIASGGMTNILNSYRSRDAEASDVKLQPVLCADTVPSMINYQHLTSTMPPPLPAKRRHSSFQTQTQQLEFVRPTGMYYEESTPAILPAFPPSHRRYLYDHEQDPQHQEMRVSTQLTKASTRKLDMSAPSYQSQRHVPEDSPPKAKCSVGFDSATPSSPTSRRKQIPLNTIDQHHPEGTPIASERMVNILNSFPGHKADVAHLKLQPELCDITMSSMINHNHLNNTMPPPLPAKRRHSSFHTQIQRLELLHPTDHHTARTAVVPAFPPSHRRYLSDHEQDQQHQEVHVRTPRSKEPTRKPDTSAPSHQSQQQSPEDTPPKAKCSVSFVSARPPSPTNRRKQIPPNAQGLHHAGGPPTASGGMPSILKADVLHLKLQPEHCDDTIPSVINYQHLNCMMPPPLPAKRRHSSFHTQTHRLEFLRPTDVYYEESTTAVVPAFPPNDMGSLSDEELDQHQQEVSASTLRHKESNREPDTSAPSYRKLRLHRSQGRNCKDVPPAPDPRSTEYETATPTHDADSQIMATLPRHYQHNHHTTLVNPRYSNFVPSRTRALPRSASTLDLYTSQNPRYLGTVRHTAPSRHFGSSVAELRPSHLRNVSSHRQYHEY